MPEGIHPGGAALYAALAARALLSEGDVTVVTRVGPDFAFRALLEGAGVDLFVHPAPATTTFENRYDPVSGRRAQWLHAWAAPLSKEIVSALPEAVRESRIVHLAPIAREVDLEVIEAFPQGLIGLSPQGFMRRWPPGGGRVEAVAWEGIPSAWRDRISVLSLSEEDVAPFPEIVEELAGEVPILLLTRGARGVRVISGESCIDLPAFPVEAIDPTGAGDVFMAAFLVAFAEGRNTREAAIFATCAASFAVCAAGVSGIATRARVLERVERYEREVLPHARDRSPSAS